MTFETAREVIPRGLQVCFIGRITLFSLGFVRFEDKHNTQFFYLQVFRAFFRNKYRILCSIITIAAVYQYISLITIENFYSGEFLLIPL